MAARKKLVATSIDIIIRAFSPRSNIYATSEAGFISVESSTPEKPKGMFIPLVETLWRSPSKRKTCEGLVHETCTDLTE